MGFDAIQECGAEAMVNLVAVTVAAHESPRTTKHDDRTGNEIMLDEVGRTDPDDHALRRMPNDDDNAWY
jgi:hypothetical protein